MDEGMGMELDDDMDDGDGIDIGGMNMCGDCEVNPANVHLTHVEKNESQTFHLCEDCARKRGVPIPDKETLLKALDTAMDNPTAFADNMTVNQAFKHSKAGKGGGAKSEEEPDIQCSNCGMKFSEFRSAGRLGCAECYGSFEERIDKILIQVHGAGLHSGKKYGKSTTRRGGRRDLERLRRELNEAVSDERFEQAAVIRDTIRSIGQTVK